MSVGAEWNLKPSGTEALDGDSLSYTDMMERAMLEERRRERERAIMEEGRSLWQNKKREQLEQEIREQEEIKACQHVNLFGKPGHGAPTEEIRKRRFTEYQLSDGTDNIPAENGDHPYSAYPVAMDDSCIPNRRSGNGNSHRPPYATEDQNGLSRMKHLSKSVPDIAPIGDDALSFGRPGCGAPARTSSGRIRTTLIGNPELRFQPNEGVQKSIINNIRYTADRGTKEAYQNVLEAQIAERKTREYQEKEHDIAVARELNQYEGNQWGRPGPGGPYWRERTLTGQGFFEKMGWSSSADPRRRAGAIKHIEAEDMKKEMNEVQMRKYAEYDDIRSSVGVELTPLMKNMPTGNPRKDPSTGYMMNHSNPSTDVTRAQDPKHIEPHNALPAYPRQSPLEEKKTYYTELANQVVSKAQTSTAKARMDEEQQRQHFQHWDTYWGRPGYGAPKAHGPQKENLMKILHYPASQSPTNVELITLERLPIKP